MPILAIHAQRVHVAQKPQLFTFGFKQDDVAKLKAPSNISLQVVGAHGIRNRSQDGIFLVNEGHESTFAKHAPEDVRAVSVSLNGRLSLPPEETADSFRHFITLDRIDDIKFLQRLYQCNGVFGRQDQINEMAPSEIKSIQGSEPLVAWAVNNLPEPLSEHDREHLLNCRPCAVEIGERLSERVWLNEAMKLAPQPSVDFQDTILRMIDELTHTS